MAESIEDFLDRYPESQGECNSTEALVGVALSRALKPHRQTLMGVGVTIVEVPDASWLAETRRQAKQIWPERLVEIAPDSSKMGRDTTPANWLKEIKANIAMGCGPIIVTVHTDKRVPKFVSVAADLSVVVPPPDLETVIEAGRMVLKGQVRRFLRDVDVSGLDLDTLSACLARGTRAKVAAQRLGNATSRAPVEADDGIPSLASVAGYGEALEWSRNLVSDLRDYRAGSLPWTEVDSGAVLYGPPGTGKSLFARITASAAGVPLLTTSVAELFTSTDGHLDNVLKRLRAIFDEAVRNAPSLLFVDELDGLPRRGAGGPNENYWRPLVNDLLMMLDSSSSRREGVVILAATNRLEDVDSALLRSQRLSRLLYVGPPAAPELARILRFYLKEDLPDADLVPLVSARPGATGADAVSWARDARRRARKAGRPMIYDDIAVEVVGIETRTAETLRRIAIHEAGHVVAAYALGLSVDLVTLAGDARNGGYVMLAKDTEMVSTKSRLEREVIAMLGGRAAEHAVFGSDHSTAAGGAVDSDLGRATRMIVDWHAQWGLADSLLYRAPDPLILERDPVLRQSVKDELDRLYGFAQGIMVTHYGALRGLALELVERQTLGSADIHILLEAIWSTRAV